MKWLLRAFAPLLALVGLSTALGAIGASPAAATYIYDAQYNSAQARAVSDGLRPAWQQSRRAETPRAEAAWGAVADAGVATNSLATSSDEAVFWSGIRGGDSAASTWVAKNGGATLETTLAERGVHLPVFNRADPASVAAWRQASADFAAGARGNVRVLQSDAVGVNSIWGQVEYPALKANPNVTSIVAVDPATGAETVLWTR